MAEKDMGTPLHSLIIPGTLHSLEEEMLNKFTDWLLFFVDFQLLQ